MGAVAAAALFGGIGVTIGAVTFGSAALGVVSAWHLDNQAKKQQRKLQQQLAAEQIRGISTTVQEPAGIKRIFYGENLRMGGNRIFMHTANKTDLYMILVFAPHRIGTPDIFAGDEKLSPAIDSPGDSNWKTAPNTSVYHEKIRWRFHNMNAESSYDEVLSAKIPDKWTEDHRLDGAAYIVFWLRYDQTTFANGLPHLTIQSHGKPLLDPRAAGPYYNSNPALAVYDYLINEDYGLGIPTADVNTASVIAAANICDQLVGEEKRYKIHGAISTADTPESNLQKMLSAMAGALVNIGGEWFIYAGAWRSPSVSFSENDIIGPLRYTSSVSRRDLFNSVKGLFVDPETSQPADYPSIREESLIIEDGRVIWMDLSFEMVNDAAQAQRLATIEIKKNRKAKSLELPVSLAAGLQVAPGDNIYLSIERYGWENKTFEVKGWRLFAEESGALGISLSLIESAAAVYDDSSVAAYVASPSTTLPKPSDVSPPTGLTVQEVLRSIGDVVENWIIFSWTSPETYFVSGYEMRYKKSTGDYVYLGFQAGTLKEFILSDAGNFAFEVRTVNSLGAVSAWAVADKEIFGKTAPPSDVTGLSGQLVSGGYLLRWDPVPDLDLFEYSIRQGWTYPPDGPFFFTRSKTSEYLSPYLVLPKGVDEVGLLWTVWAIDTSDIYSVNAAAHEFTVQRPIPPQNLQEQGVVNRFYLYWESSKTTYSIQYYEIYRVNTETEELGNKIAEVNATYFSSEEFSDGTYQYAIIAVDAAGNKSEASISNLIYLTGPQGFKAATDWNHLLTDSYGNCDITEARVGRFGMYILWAGLKACITLTPEEAGLPDLPDNGEYIVLGTDAAETVEEHWENKGYSTIQDVIDAGNTYILEPLSTEERTMAVTAPSLIDTETQFDWGAFSTEGDYQVPASATITVAVQNNVDYHLLFGAAPQKCLGSALMVQVQDVNTESYWRGMPRWTGYIYENGGYPSIVKTNQFYYNHTCALIAGYTYKLADEHSIVVMNSITGKVAQKVIDISYTGECFAEDRAWEDGGTEIGFSIDILNPLFITGTVISPAGAVLSLEILNRSWFKAIAMLDGVRVDCTFTYTVKGI